MWSALKGIIFRHRIILLVIVLTWGVYFIALFARMIDMRPEGFFVGHQNVWSDWALHTAQANTFAFKSPDQWFDYHPLFADGKFTYPFLTNFISGMLMRLGFSLSFSFAAPSIVFVLLLLLGMYALLFQITWSKTASFLAMTFLFLSAGFGFIDFFKDIADNGWSLIQYPPKDYSVARQYDWYAGNISVGLLIPQRAFLLGMTLGVWILALFYYASSTRVLTERSRKKLMCIAGCVAGIMPIAHAHSFMVVAFTTALMSLVFWRQWRLWIWFAVPATILSAFFYLQFVAGGIQREHFLGWSPGWTAPGGLWSWIVMWLTLWGLMIPTTIVGLLLFWEHFDKRQRTIFFAAFLIFTIANFVLFQPVRWDNTKLFWWSYLIFSAAAALTVVWLWRQRWSGKILSVILVTTLTMTGIIESIRLQRIDKHTIQVTSDEDIELGLQIRRSTDPSARFLTAPQHNHFIMVWALRPILLGYTAWAWNYGFKYEQHEADMRRIYVGVSEAEVLLRNHRISYVVVGPTEKYDLHVNENFFQSRFPVAFSNQNYQVYDTRALLR